MTAIEVIDQIKALAPDERAKVFGFLHQLETRQVPSVEMADDKAFDEAAKWVFREHSDLMHRLSQ